MTDDRHPSLSGLERRRQRRAETQRQRRAVRRRLDFYASAEALRIIDGLRFASVGGDASSILNRIVLEWSAARAPKGQWPESARFRNSLSNTLARAKAVSADEPAEIEAMRESLSAGLTRMARGQKGAATPDHSISPLATAQREPPALILPHHLGASQP